MKLRHRSTAKPANRPYQAFSKIYDRIMGGRYGRLWWKTFSGLVRRHGVAFTSVVDLAGGTGEAAVRFQRQGKRVWLVDCSPAMVAQARRRLPKGCCRLSDIRHFCLPRPVDLAVVVFGGLHYLPSVAALQRCFRQIRRNLNPGGHLCFDLFSVRFLKRYYGGGRELFAGKDYVSLWKHAWDPDRRRSIIQVVSAERRPSGWIRYPSERHVHQAFTLNDVRQALRAEDFVLLATADLQTGAPPPAGQRVFLARRVS